MAEEQDKESKTEDATEKKVRDSVDKGQIPVSKEASLLASFVAILLFAIFFAYDSAIQLAGFLTTFIEKPHDWMLASNEDVIELLRLVFLEIVKAVGIVMILMFVAGISASILQNPPAFVVDRIQPKWSRVSLKQGWKRLFGAQGVAEFLKSLGKVTFAAAFLIFTMRHAYLVLLDGMAVNPASFGQIVRSETIQILIAITLVMTLIAVADLMWSRFHWRQELRMTRQEVKDEIKQTDGDPIVKSRLRSIARDRARKRMMQAVPKATLIIANPTHYSIALRYDQKVDAAPIVVAKGQDLLALKIREIAEEHKIPIFENVALARSMYKQVSVDSMIPPQFYQAVAELIKIVFARTQKAQQRRDLQ